MKRVLRVSLLICLIFSVCGCGNNVISENNSIVGTTEEQIQVDNNELEQYEGIISFYDSMVDLKSTVENNSYTSLNQTMKNMSSVVSEFENLPESTNEDYNQYILSMKENPMYEVFKSYIDGTYDMDYSLTSDFYAEFVIDAVDVILEQQLPFEYEKQVTVIDEARQATDYAEKATEFKSILNTAINDGTDITLDHALGTSGWYYAFSKEYSLLSSKYPESTVRTGLYFKDDGGYGIFINVNFGTFSYVPEKFRISDQTNEVIINTTQMDDFGINGYRYLYFYQTEWDESMNSNLDKVRDIFENSDHVYFATGEEEYCEMPIEYIRTTRDFFELYDVLQMLYAQDENMAE